MKIAIYPGSFDPITFGHIDITERACALFDKVIVSVAESKSKNPLFSVAERIDLAQEIFKDNPKIEMQIRRILFGSSSILLLVNKRFRLSYFQMIGCLWNNVSM